MGTTQLAQLEHLGRLEDGWHDGEGLAPSHCAFEVAFPLAKAFSNNCVSIFPTLTGGLHFQGTNFEIWISACGISEISTDSKEGAIDVPYQR